VNTRIWKNLAKKLDTKPRSDEERSQAKRAEAEGGVYLVRA